MAQRSKSLSGFEVCENRDVSCQPCPVRMYDFGAERVSVPLTLHCGMLVQNKPAVSCPSLFYRKVTSMGSK